MDGFLLTCSPADPRPHAADATADPNRRAPGCGLACRRGPVTGSASGTACVPAHRPTCAMSRPPTMRAAVGHRRRRIGEGASGTALEMG